MEEDKLKRFKQLAGNLRKGVPIATPVFDGASEEEIFEILQKYRVCGLPAVPGSATLVIS
mgnify:CR=1 FL=1